MSPELCEKVLFVFLLSTHYTLWARITEAKLDYTNNILTLFSLWRETADTLVHRLPAGVLLV